MNNVEVTGMVKEILFKGERSCKFLIELERTELLGTITSKNIELSNTLEVGQAYKFRGNIAAFKRNKDDKLFIENTFYIIEAEKVA